MAVLAALLTLPAALHAADDKYEGVRKCKPCHEAKSKGSQVTAWQATDHAKAFERLSGPEAKEVGEKLGVADPANDPKCVKCHTTAFGASSEQLGRRFNKAEGITCEACHGAASRHVKARVSSEEESDGFINIPDAEIDKAPSAKVCLTCHNKESPTHKPFKHSEAVKKISHPDPRRARK
ncbi:MAG: multiheme c-type cytochrome [Myxococcales bacterium]